MNAKELEHLFKSHVEKMTPRERMMAYASGEEVDCIPYDVSGCEEAMANIFGYTTAQMRDNVNVHIDVIRRREEEFGLVGLSMGTGMRAVGQALGSKLVFPEVGIDRIVQPVISSLDEMGRIVDNDPYTNPVLLRMLERACALKDAFPYMGIASMVGGPITAAASIVPIEALLRGMRKRPDDAQTLLDFCVQFTLAWVDMFVKEFGPSPFAIADPVSCADILSRKQYLEFSRPAQEKLIAGIMDLAGGKPALHICGKTNPLWDDIKELNVANFSVDNRESLANAKERLGNTFSIGGNVPPVDVMLAGSIDDVINSCKECLRQGAESPLGYSLRPGCQLPIGVPRENFQAFIYAARTYGRGAQKGKMPKGMLDEA